jgi:hypothetical protein
MMLQDFRFGRSNTMKYTDISKEEMRRRAEALYEQSIRDKVETDENIGKMVIINVETGEYEVGNETGVEAAKHLHAKAADPPAPLFGIRIGYNASATIGGVLERVTR